MHQKLLDSTVAQNFNWKPKTNILQGIEKTIEWYLKDQGGQKDV
jgi:dTDP-D-glucose 4,6-dehydratase